MRTKIDVRRAIKERFGTVSAFAAHTGMHTQNVLQNLINGNPSIKKLEELCEKMGCDVTDLFYPIDETDDTSNTHETEALVENKQEESLQHCDNLKNTSTSLIQPSPVFCPHCGRQVRVGVVLLPDE